MSTDNLPSEQSATALDALRKLYQNRQPSMSRNVRRIHVSDLQWAIAEIDRLREDLARYENAHKVLVDENKRLKESVETLTASANEWMDRAITAEANALQAGKNRDS